MHPLYINALEKRKLLLAELAQTDRFIADWQKASDVNRTNSDFKFTLSDTRKMNPKKELVIEKVCEILLENGKPMTRADIHAKLIDAGVILFGKNPSGLLATLLHRSDKIYYTLNGHWLEKVSVKKYGYTAS